MVSQAGYRPNCTKSVKLTVRPHKQEFEKVSVKLNEFCFVEYRMHES